MKKKKLDKADDLTPEEIEREEAMVKARSKIVGEKKWALSPFKKGWYAALDWAGSR